MTTAGIQKARGLLDKANELYGRTKELTTIDTDNSHRLEQAKKLADLAAKSAEQARKVSAVAWLCINMYILTIFSRKAKFLRTSHYHPTPLPMTF